MQAITSLPPESEQAFQRAGELVQRILETISVEGETKFLSASEDFFKKNSPSSHIYILTEGNVTLFNEDSLTFTLEPNDIIGIEQIVGIPIGRYSHEFAVQCRIIPYKDFIDALGKSPECLVLWSSYLMTLSAAYGACSTHLIPADKQFSPVMRGFKAGEVIIEEDTLSDEVYSLVSGHAEVKLKGIKVGEIQSDEIFGALAALTGLPRTASVIATKESLVLALNKDQFIELMKHRPTTVYRMVETMARTIFDLNRRVVSLSENRPTVVPTWS